MPLVFSFHPALRFYKNWTAFFKASLIVSVFFISWDILFTKQGVWGFNPRYVCGVYLFGLPIEEVLFFICIPYASVFTYHCFGSFFKGFRIPPAIVTISLMAACLILVILGFNRLYTMVTALLLMSLLVYTGFVKKPVWLSLFYVMYLVILIPFFIVNGILTGSWIAEPVVWYNNDEILGLRLLTIPVEDVFYGLLLLLLNVLLYEKFRRSGIPA